MQIHVIQPGQSLWGIAQAYGTTVEEIVRANALPNAGQLVVGQALVIPINGQYYWVQPGDSLYTIAARFGLSVQRLASVNQLNLNMPLQVGVRLYIPPQPKVPTEANAYIEPRGESVSPELLQAAQEAAPYLTYLAPFSFQIQRDGTLDPPPLESLPAVAEQHGVTLMMVVTNLENEQFSDELGRIILNDEAVQTRLLDNILDAAARYGFRDIHFDLEFLRPADREAYNRFLRRAAARIHEQGYLISTALAPKTSATQAGAWYEAHDYRAHGEIVDFVVIMTYEWGYSGGPPMPVSPIGPVRQVLEYALTEMPGSKIMMGQNLYGYDWTLPFVPGGEYARALSPQAAIALAARENAAIQYDWQAQAPHFDYVDDEGASHKVWFEDARSIQAKFNLMKELGLRGISYWKLGLPFPQNWLLLDSNFTIVKNPAG
ncbi:LysM peptidoglycan-binding domain-containing protein [Xylanibacillus composti]|uniref:Spore germination protein YaaH n=1 Tax=Xylanibacillus composti TaxID=1572762 RepID=A0A8J4H123_9BACL|nr:glycoside hydrolase family 18 protein [Xylanibacillus composti]MDT9726569.1 LysM peptidoglycan-binding domain-containing protein [Xylanibacillus composti]GIQ68987.1 spore germination protein YaaH [Xylanibacillus composti]